MDFEKATDDAIRVFVAVISWACLFFGAAFLVGAWLHKNVEVEIKWRAEGPQKGSR